MKIEKLEIRNVKGLNAVYPTSEINLVRGPNWSGKTTLLTAIRIALLGYDPALGKRPSDTMRLAAGDSMSVALHTSAGKVERQWKRKGEKCSQVNTLPDGFSVPAMMIEIDSWFSMTAQQRRDYIISQASVDDDITKLDNGLLTRIEAIACEDDDAKAELKDILEEVQHYMDDRDAEETPVADWFSLQIERTKERVRESALIDSQTTALIETIMQERVANTETLPADQSERIRELNAGIQRLVQQREENKKLAELAVVKSRAVDDLKSLEGEDVAGESLIIQKEMEKERMKLATVAGDFTMQKFNECGSRLANHRTAMARLKDRLAIFQANLNEINAIDPETACCPTCKRKATDAMRQNIIADKRAKVESATENLNRVNAEIEKLKPILEEDETTYVKLKTGYDAQLEFDKATSVLRARLEPWNFKANRISTLRDKIEALAHIDAESIGRDLMPEINTLSEELTKCEALAKRRVLMLERNGQEADALANRDSARRKSVVQKAALAVMEDMQKQYVSDVFGPFLKQVRKFTDGLLPFELAHREGELGYLGKRGWVSHKTFSGAEKAIVYAGLGVALGGKNASIAVILLDELLVAEENKAPIVNRFRQLIADGVISQVFIADTSAWAVEGVNVINVSQQ